MEYLLAWRMALAKDLLRRRELGIEAVAERVGYGSASTFSTASAGTSGWRPGRYARAAEVPVIQRTPDANTRASASAMSRIASGLFNSSRAPTARTRASSCSPP